MLQRSIAISTTTAQAAVRVESLRRSMANQIPAASRTKANERQAPRKTAELLACTRSTRLGSAKDSAMLVKAPKDASTAITPPPMSQPMMYLRDMR